MGEKEIKPQKPRVRSPAYPAIPLERAIERAREFYDAERRNETLVDVAASHWGYKPKGSIPIQTVAALKYFGLLEESGSGAERKVKLTELALDILLDEREDSRDKRKAVQVAALRPKIHADLWEKWQRDLPSDASLRTYLIRERNFNEETVGSFIGEYKDTLGFSGLLESGTLSSVLEEETMAPEVQLRAASEVPRMPPPSCTQEEREYFVVRLAGGRVFRLVGCGPEPTQKVWSKLIAHLDLNKDEFPADEAPSAKTDKEEDGG